MVGLGVLYTSCVSDQAPRGSLRSLFMSVCSFFLVCVCMCVCVCFARSRALCRVYVFLSCFIFARTVCDCVFSFAFFLDGRACCVVCSVYMCRFPGLCVLCAISPFLLLVFARAMCV